MGGEVGLARLKVESKTVVTVPVGKLVTVCMPSGLVEDDVFGRGTDISDTKLPLEELLEIANGMDELIGREVLRLCLDRNLANTITRVCGLAKLEFV
jgi:hypothetical protein